MNILIAILFSVAKHRDANAHIINFNDFGVVFAKLKLLNGMQCSAMRSKIIITKRANSEENELMNSMLFVIGNKGKIICNFGPEARKGMNHVNAGIFINENSHDNNLSSDGTAETAAATTENILTKRF